MAVMRAVEGGFALVRAARDGYLSVHDAWGNLIAERRSADPVALLIADAPMFRWPSARRRSLDWRGGSASPRLPWQSRSARSPSGARAPGRSSLSYTSFPARQFSGIGVLSLLSSPPPAWAVILVTLAALLGGVGSRSAGASA